MRNQPTIVLYGRKRFTRKELFAEKADFHRKQAKLPFEEKIKILVKLQKIAKNIKNKKDIFVWQI